MVQYVSDSDVQGGGDNDIKSLSCGILWRALPLALCALTTETDEADTQELLSPSCKDACVQFLQDNPVAPGHAGSAILLLKPLKRAANLMKRRGVFIALAKKCCTS